MNTSKSALLFLALTCSIGASTEEINKWVDADGVVHFSDRAPKNKGLKVEKVENKQPAKLGLSTEELSEQKRRTVKYQNDLKTQQHKNRKTNTTKKASPKPNTLEIDKEQGLKLCRNSYPNNTKKRTQCFNQLYKQKSP